MDHVELHEAINTLVSAVAEVDPAQDWNSVTHLLDVGEEEEAMDVLIATVVRSNVPVTRSQRDSLRQIMAEFEFTAESRPLYRYLGDPEMLDRMTVVDGSS